MTSLNEPVLTVADEADDNKDDEDYEIPDITEEEGDQPSCNDNDDDDDDDDTDGFVSSSFRDTLNSISVVLLILKTYFFGVTSSNMEDSFVGLLEKNC
ncbi:hypothetical protein L6452_09110 [Arctium lappa]|uniref:Uncharacterized protein n=1 Tax=Arctium lappa TaxID=4217 RepID=A0ACB9DJK8_ARCLA|nr:hypothetical protein L6452_09110 [Arctium lappa]